MKKLLLKLLLLFVLAVVIAAGIYGIMCIFKVNTSDMAHEIFGVVEKAEVYSGKSSVVIGDSVANQIWEFSENSDDLCHLASNQGITACGNYLLLLDYLENNPQTKNVFYVVRPQSLSNDFRPDFTYQYMVLPFRLGSRLNDLDSSSVNKLYDIYGRIYIDNTLVQTVLLNNTGALNIYLQKIQTDEEADYYCFSETSATYIKKMAVLCKSRGIEFSVVPGPLPESDRTVDWSAFKDDCKRLGVSDIMNSYISGIFYYPDSSFIDDNVHFKGSFIKEHLEEIRSLILSNA